MSLTEEDILKISEKVTSNVLSGVEKKAADYYVDRKKHWQHHLWLGWIIGFLKFIVFATCVGVLAYLGKGIMFIFKKGLLSIAVPGGFLKRIDKDDDNT